MFTQEQLAFLLHVQSEDWTPRYFRHLVQQSSSRPLIEYVNSLSIDQIQDLQFALDILASLPVINQVAGLEKLPPLGFRIFEIKNKLI